MNWNDYQLWTIETAIYPGAGKGAPEAIRYCALGLGGEMFEVADKLELGDRDGLLAELGDVAYYLARLFGELDVPARDTATEAQTFHYAAGRIGRVLEMVKKADRKGGDAGVAALRGSPLATETLNDAFNAFIGYVWSKGPTLGQVLDKNQAKLMDRLARNAIQGSGDAR
jgi:hypothetical protein